MSDRTARDRRPILNAIVGLLILVVAAALFWPRGGGEQAIDSLVLTPDSGDAESLQAAVEVAEAGSVDEAESAAPAEDAFVVEDATLEPEPVATTPASQPASQPVSRPIRQRTGEPSASGSYFLVVGSYEDAQNAESEIARLSGSGVRANSVATGGKYRVQVGYFQSREDAEAYGRKLKQSLKLDFWISSR